MKRFTDEGDIITVCDKCGTHLDKPNNIGWIMATVESVDMFGIRGPHSGGVGVKDVLELCWSCYFEIFGFRYFHKKGAKDVKMKMMVVKMDDVRAVLAQRGITGSDVDAAIAALPAWDWLSTEHITIGDYIRGLDTDTELLQYLNALIGEYADDGPGFAYLSKEDISFNVPTSMSPADVGNITASYKEEKKCTRRF